MFDIIDPDNYDSATSGLVDTATYGFYEDPPLHLDTSVPFLSKWCSAERLYLPAYAGNCSDFSDDPGLLTGVNWQLTLKNPTVMTSIALESLYHPNPCYATGIYLVGEVDNLNLFVFSTGLPGYEPSDSTTYTRDLFGSTLDVSRVVWEFPEFLVNAIVIGKTSSSYTEERVAMISGLEADVPLAPPEFWTHFHGEREIL